MRRKAEVTHRQLFDARDTLKARGYRHIESRNEVPAEGVEFGSLWVRDSDGARFWLNFRTIGNLPE